MSHTHSHHNHDHHNQEHKHDHKHAHSHDHGGPIMAYFIGLALAILGLLLPQSLGFYKNVLFALASLAAGYDVILLEGIGETVEKSKKLGRFTPNSHILMGLAALGASILGNFWEGTLLILIFAGAHFLEDYAEGQSRREISKLIEMNPSQARRLNGQNEIEMVDVEDLKVGDRIQVLNGDQIPIDGLILTGNTSINEAAINGESIPRDKAAGDTVYASTINGQGSFIMQATKESGETLFAKIIQLVEQNQAHPTPAENRIQQFEPSYVSFVLMAIPILILVGPFLFNWTWADSFYRGLVILVAASPCALAAATISATLSTTSNLASRGILSKGSSYLSQLANIQAIAFDKTGTLTQGKPQVTDAYFIKESDSQSLLEIITAMEKEANHPLAQAILEKYPSRSPIDLKVENQIGQGLTAQYQGKIYRIGKPTSFQSVRPNIAEKEQEWSHEGKTVIFIAQDEEVLAAMALMDLPRPEAQASINYFKQAGVHTSLITGDSQATGQAVGHNLAIDQVLANVMPEAKSQAIEEIQAQYGTTAMLGDGVNDAPALVKADVGIAMGEGSGVALDVADLALMQNDLKKLVQAHKLSQKMNRIIWQNIVFSMLVVVFLIGVSLLGLTDMTLSVIVHEGSTLVVIFNGLRLLRGGD